jgi:hypothetical protein
MGNHNGADGLRLKGFSELDSEREHILRENADNDHLSVERLARQDASACRVALIRRSMFEDLDSYGLAPC